MPIFGNVNPEDTIWYPHDDGDYSDWVDQFNRRMNKWCSTPKHFEVGVERSSLPDGLFNSMSSDTNYNNLADNVIAADHLSHYLKSKAGWLALLVLSIVTLIASGVAAFFLLQRFRRWWSRKFCGCVHDRARVPEDSLSKKGLLLTKISTLTIIAAMFIMSISGFVLSGLLSEGLKSASCDAWNSMRGHYFGALDMAVAPNVVSDWKGSQVQRKDMLDLLNQISGNETVPPAIYTEIHDKLFNELEPTLNSISYDLGMHMNESKIRLHVLESLNTPLKNTKDLFGTGEGTEDIVLASHVDLMMLDNLEMYRLQLVSTAAEGIKTAAANLDESLGSNTSLVLLAQDTTQTALSALNDVDYVMAKMLVMWDHQIAPLFYVVIYLLLALAIILGILAFAGSAFGGLFLWRIGGFSIKRVTTPSQKTTKFLGVFYGCMVVMSGLAFLLGSVFLLVGSIGKDACGVVTYTAFRDGKWSVFPNALFDMTVSNKTDVFTVLDTCVLDSGDGDISAALNIDMLLGNLKNGVAKTRAKLLDLIDAVTKEGSRRPKVESLADVNNDIVNMMWIQPIARKSGILSIVRYEAYSDFTGLRGNSTDFSRSHVCAVNALGEYVDFAGLLKECINGVTYQVPGIDAALRKVDSVVAAAGSDLTPTRYCSKLIDYCTDGPDTRVYTFSAESIRTDLNEVFNLFRADDAPVDTPGGELTILQLNSEGQKLSLLIEQVMAVERWFVRPLTDFSFGSKTINATDLGIFVPETAELPVDSVNRATGGKHVQQFVPVGPIPVPDPAKVPINIALKWLFPDTPTCTFNLVDYSGTLPVCTFKEFAEEIIRYSGSTGDHMLGSFNEALDAVSTFTNTEALGRVDTMLAEAYANLENFNCQFVGMSLKQGFAKGLCEIVLPSTASLGIYSVVLCVVALAGAVLLWKVWHYFVNLRDLGEKSVLGKEDSEAGLCAGRDISVSSSRLHVNSFARQSREVTMGMSGSYDPDTN